MKPSSSKEISDYTALATLTGVCSEEEELTRPFEVQSLHHLPSPSFAPARWIFTLSPGHTLGQSHEILCGSCALLETLHSPEQIDCTAR